MTDPYRRTRELSPSPPPPNLRKRPSVGRLIKDKAGEVVARVRSRSRGPGGKKPREHPPMPASSTTFPEFDELTRGRLPVPQIAPSTRRVTKQTSQSRLSQQIADMDALEMRKADLRKAPKSQLTGSRLPQQPPTIAGSALGSKQSTVTLRPKRSFNNLTPLRLGAPKLKPLSAQDRDEQNRRR